MAEVSAQADPTSDDKRALYNGFGNAFARGMELSLTTVVFALCGLWLDARFATKPIFTLTLTLLAIVGLAVRAYYTYVADMEREEAGKPWAIHKP